MHVGRVANPGRRRAALRRRADPRGQEPRKRQRNAALGGGRGSLRRGTSTCNQCGSHRKRRKPTVGKVPPPPGCFEGRGHAWSRISGVSRERCTAEGPALGLGGWEVH